MSFEFGMKGYSFGLIAIICWIVSIIFSLMNIALIGNIAGIAVFVFGILAFINGKKEFAFDNSNKKAKTGKTIGLVIIILELISFAVIIAVSGLLISAAIA